MQWHFTELLLALYPHSDHMMSALNGRPRLFPLINDPPPSLPPSSNPQFGRKKYCAMYWCLQFLVSVGERAGSVYGIVCYVE